MISPNQFQRNSQSIVQIQVQQHYRDSMKDTIKAAPKHLDFNHENKTKIMYVPNTPVTGGTGWNVPDPVSYFRDQQSEPARV